LLFSLTRTRPSANSRIEWIRTNASPNVAFAGFRGSVRLSCARENRRRNGGKAIRDGGSHY
jgi:hypothetical protein